MVGAVLCVTHVEEHTPVVTEKRKLVAAAPSGKSEGTSGIKPGFLNSPPNPSSDTPTTPDLQRSSSVASTGDPEGWMMSCGVQPLTVLRRASKLHHEGRHRSVPSQEL